MMALETDHIASMSIKLLAVVSKYDKILNDLIYDYMLNWKNQYIDTPYGRCYIDEYTHAKNIETLRIATLMFNPVKIQLQYIGDKECTGPAGARMLNFLGIN